MKKAIFTILILMVAMTVIAKNIRTVTFTTAPQMHCTNCETKTKNNLRFTRGVKEIKTDVGEQKVYITYGAQRTNGEELQRAFEKFGYEAEETTREAKTPIHEDEECENM